MLSTGLATRKKQAEYFTLEGKRTLSSSFSSDGPGAVGVKGSIPLWVLITFTVLSLEISSVQAQTMPGKVKATLLDITEDSKAEISVLVSDATFAFGVSTLDTWLTPQLSILINDGAVAENLVGQISQFTDGSNLWEISSSVNGADSIRAQWSTESDSGLWNDISDYDTDFTIATNVAASDSVIFWFRIQTPLSTSSYNQHSSTLTVTAVQY